MPANLPLLYGSPSLLDRLMDQEDFSPLPAPQEVSARHFPPLQIFEDEENLYVRALLPGVPLENVVLTLESGALVLRGVVPHSPGIHLRRDRPAGPFRRDVPLPYPVDHARISAIIRYGILTVTLPKSSGSRKRTIPVHDAARRAS